MLAPWKKSYDSILKNILKSRDITLPEKVCLAKAMVFPVKWSEYHVWLFATPRIIQSTEFSMQKYWSG